MPDTNFPKLNKWLPKLKQIVDTPDENLFLVGHSIGVITILRLLESFTSGKELHKVQERVRVPVAGHVK